MSAAGFQNKKYLAIIKFSAGGDDKSIRRSLQEKLRFLLTSGDLDKEVSIVEELYGDS